MLLRYLLLMSFFFYSRYYIVELGIDTYEHRMNVVSAHVGASHAKLDGLIFHLAP